MSGHRLPYDGYLAPYEMTDPGDGGKISADRQFGVVPLVTKGVETREVEQPTKAGLLLSLVLNEDGGDCTVTIAGGYDQAGKTTAVLGDAGDFIAFMSFRIGSACYWRMLGSDGVSGPEEQASEIAADEVTTKALEITESAIKSSVGAGAKNGATVEAAEYGDGVLHKTVLTCAATPLTFGDEAGQGQYGGVKIYDFPEGLILTLGAVIDGAITLTAPAINTWDGDIGLGVEAPTDHQDAANKTGLVMPKVATAQAVAKAATVDGVSAATALAECGARWLDGTAAAKDLFLNLLIDDNAAHDNTIAGTFTGTVTILWMNIGDK